MRRSGGARSVLLWLGGGLVVLGVLTCMASLGLTVAGAEAWLEGARSVPPPAFFGFFAGMLLMMIGGVTAVIGAACGRRRAASDVDGYETVTRPRRGEPIARHGDSTHELIER